MMTAIHRSLPHKPIFTLLICFLTLCTSFFVAFEVSGSILGKVRIIHLTEYGGLTLNSIASLEVWRFITAQLVHVYQKHMLFNVISMLMLGLLLEPRIGFRYTCLIWLMAGATGTLISTLSGTPPWNTGSGASQAIFGLAGFSLVLFVRKIDTRYQMFIGLAFTLIPALLLDFRAVGYPKLAHVISFFIGGLIAIYYCYHKHFKNN